MDESERYLLKVDNWVLEAVSGGVSSFQELTAGLPGVYPTCIRDSLQNLSRSGDISPDTLQSLCNPALSYSSSPAFSETDHLPLPHPLDFEWRFSWEASERILGLARRLAGGNDEILLLSTPSVFYYALQKNDTSRLRYIGDTTIVTEFLCGIPNTQAKCDFFTAKPRGIEDAGVVVIDPPWYEEFLHSFMWLAAASCKIGGYVIVSFPPQGTRPGIEAEWLRFLKLVQEVGMILVCEEEGFLPYDSPFFEVNALHAEGISIPRSWRKGIMRVFKKVTDVRISKPVAKPRDKWNEYQLGSVRLKLRPPTVSVEETDPRLSAIVPGEVFPSVSRRDPRRKLVDVWTSGNRVFKCCRTDVLENIIMVLQHLQPSPSLELISKEFPLIERPAVEHTAMQLFRIIEKEESELMSLIYGKNDF